MLSRYLKTLDDQLAEAGFSGNLYLMLSSGSSALACAAHWQPIRLVESGPAAGALAAAYYGELTGHRDLISFDMGGTAAAIHQLANENMAAAARILIQEGTRDPRNYAMICLSFIGLSASAPTPEWGAMVAWGRLYFLTARWIGGFPGLGDHPCCGRHYHAGRWLE